MSVTISGKLKRLSQRALLIDLEDGNDAQWIPFSQIDDFEEGTFDDSVGQSIELDISDWIAGQKNIRPVNLERYDVGPSVTDNNETWVSVVDRQNGPEMCRCKERRVAIMIAAALNLTQGKV